MLGEILDNNLNNLNFTSNNGYISVGNNYQNLNINYSDYKFKKVLYDGTFSPES